MSCAALGHRTGCNCAVARGLELEQAQLEDLVRAGGEQGPTTEEITIDRLQEKVRSLEAERAQLRERVRELELQVAGPVEGVPGGGLLGETEGGIG